MAKTENPVILIIEPIEILKGAALVSYGHIYKASTAPSVKP